MKRNINFKHTSLFALLCLLFMQMLVSCDGEKDLKIIEGNLPIKTSTLFMVGDATPNGWSIDAPTPFTASEADPMVFEWTGSLNKGEMKLCLTTGSWDAAFIRPMTAGEEISKTNITNKTFDMHAGDPDNKWKVTEEGKYKLSFDMRNWTFSTEYLGEKEKPAVEPIEAENLYMVGDATPNGWNIDAPTVLTKQGNYVFVYEGELKAGDLKCCLKTGDWGQPFVRPDAEGVKINKDGVESPDFVFTASPDNKWKVEEGGNYRLTFDLEHRTFKAEYLGAIEVAKDPIVADNVWMIGTATPGGWSLDDAAQYTKDANNKYLFTWEGELKLGTLKACTKKDFSAAFIRPSSANVAITKQGVAADDFVFTTSPDDQWEVKEAGKYRITLDLEHYTIKVEKKD